MTYPDHHAQSGRAVILIVVLSVVVTLGAGAVLLALALSTEPPARPSSSQGAGDSGPGDILPPIARAAP